MEYQNKVSDLNHREWIIYGNPCEEIIIEPLFDYEYVSDNLQYYKFQYYKVQPYHIYEKNRY